MIRKLFKKKQSNSTIKAFIKKYKIPQEYLSVNRKSISKGVFIGLFWGFIPMPMQMLAVLAITPFMKFNVPIAISIVWLSNPITMPFMYYMEYQTGTYLLGLETIQDASFKFEFTVSWFRENWSNLLYPLYIGTIPYSIGFASFMYLIINKLWIDAIKKETSARKKRFLKFRRKKKIEE